VSPFHRLPAVTDRYPEGLNERTVSVDHVAEVAVRHPEIVQVGRRYGMTIRIAGLRLGPHSSPGRGPG
jgi:hypothetical protein